MENVRIAIRDSTDSFNIGFFDNQAGIKYNSADLNRFLAGSASILTLRYYSKDIDTIRTGCKLSFEYKDESYWLNILEVKKTGFNVELTAFSTNLEDNNEVIGPYKAQSGEKIVSYINRFDPEHAFTIGINEVADKSIKLEWTGKDTVLARLYSVANFFDAELEFVTQLNSDYSLKRHVLNIYKKGNLGRVINSPVRVGKDLKTIDYEDSIKELRTAVYCKGKDGITIAGLNKKVYDDKGKLLYFTDGPYLRAPQAKDRYPSVGKNSPDGYILLTLDDTEHETKEALYGYMLGRIKDVSNPKLTFTAEGGFDTKIGDTRILIDDVHFEPELYVQARVIETEESMLTGKVNRTVFSNYERKYSQLSNDLLKRVEELAKEAMPYTLELGTSAGTAFKNGAGNSLITPTLKKGTETVSGASFKWTINGTSQTSNTYTMSASQVNGTQLAIVEAVLNDQVVATSEITFTNVSDGQDGQPGPPGALDEEQLNDLQGKIDSKADSQLTQEQINHLIDNNSQLERQIQSALTMAALEKWAEAYNETVTAATKEAKKKAEEALLKSSERLIEITKLGEKAQRWETSIGYIQADGNSFTIAQDGSDTKFIVTNDVISFVSGGKAVMTLTKGELSVNNGVFALSVRVGRFVVAPLESNPDINVIRYVGEVS
ncbi:phage tail protein [Streptococcus minor]|uniref:phage tail protein n=1 Tax=Streptococcus minor TaxID=229549 RepID=UPI00035EBBB4|nr:phage tail protein [Streptococcus minor]